MSYHPNIPQANDDPSVSQNDLLENFQKINSDFNVNHIPFTAGANQGFHTKVQFPTALSTAPGATGDQSILYPKFVNTVPQLFFQNAQADYQLTNLPFVNGTITNVIPGVNTQVTSAGHQLTTGNMVTIIDVVGVTGINGMTFTITVVDANTFNLNAATGGVYGGGGTWTAPQTPTPQSNRYGFRTPWGWIINMGKVNTAVFGPAVQFSIPYPVNFNTYGVFLTPATGTTQFGANPPSQTQLTWAITNNSTFNYLVIGSG